MNTCDNCGCRVYSLGCVNCDEEMYIKQQVLTHRLDEEMEQLTGEMRYCREELRKLRSDL